MTQEAGDFFRARPHQKKCEGRRDEGKGCIAAQAGTVDGQQAPTEGQCRPMEPSCRGWEHG